jgi:hypothetical protein
MFERARTWWRRLTGQTTGPETTASRGEEERRGWQRLPSSATTTITPVGEDVQPRPARVRNVSRGGINLVTSCSFEPGTVLRIELPASGGATTNTVLVCVVHATPQGDQEWALGCSFAEELSNSDLAAFGASGDPAAAKENRRWVRFICKVKATYQLANDPAQKTWPAQLLNISAAGVGLLVEQAVEIGTLVNIELRKTAGDETRTILACVVHVVAHPEHEWTLGCNFIRELSDDDLRALL